MTDLTPPKPPDSADPPQSLVVEEGKIIDLRGEPLEISEAEKKIDRCGSRHANILVDEFERTICCRECGKIMEAFDYLLGWAREGTSRMSRLKSLDNEIRFKHQELETMKAVLAREKAAVRRVNPDAPEVRTWRREIAMRKAST